jgi:hypothetical protein
VEEYTEAETVCIVCRRYAKTSLYFRPCEKNRIKESALNALGSPTKTTWQGVLTHSFSLLREESNNRQCFQEITKDFQLYQQRFSNLINIFCYNFRCTFWKYLPYVLFKKYLDRKYY